MFLKEPPVKQKIIKCIVWDLDNTVWEGILLENDQVKLREDVVRIIKELDSRGILHSIASKNDFDKATKKLREFGIFEYFLFPQIDWNPKSSSIEEIAKALNISMDTFAFIDDNSMELEEVSYTLPEVLCINAIEKIEEILSWKCMMPRFITDDSKMRRHMYKFDLERRRIEREYEGPKEEFLALLGMNLTISSVKEEDLKRAEELTIRTNQLNTTGYTYSYEELNKLRQSENHKLLIAELEDKFGSYGKIGLILLEMNQEVWTIKLLLMSCRVMSRGIGTIMMTHIMNLAKEAKVKLHAEFNFNNVNRMMYVTYKFAGFKEIDFDSSPIVLESNLSNIQDFPNYVKVSINS